MFHLFLLFRMDFANGTEYRQKTKTFRMKYNFLAGKIIRIARSVVLKLLKILSLSRDLCKKSSLKNAFLYPNLLFVFKIGQEKPFLTSYFIKLTVKKSYIGGNKTKINSVQPQPSPFWGENNGKIYLTWNPGIILFICRIFNNDSEFRWGYCSISMFRINNSWSAEKLIS